MKEKRFERLEMAAYAAVVSLMNTIHLLQNHPRYSFSFAITHITSFSEKAQIFLEFVESFNSCHGRKEDLEIQIAYVACLAEYVLTSLTSNQIRARSAFDHGEDRDQIGSSSSSNLHIKMKARKRKALEDVRSIVNTYYCHSSLLEEVEDQMSSIMEQVLKVKNQTQHHSTATEKVTDRINSITTKDQQSAHSMAAVAAATLVGFDGHLYRLLDLLTAAASTRSPTTSMVGFDGYLYRLLDLLTADLSTRQIITVVGMGGIGKTTLAKNVYHNSAIVHHFDVRAWVTVSQDYDMKEILLHLLGRKGESAKNTSDELGEQLHKKLWGRRYLIILYDMWSTDVWDRIRFFFPDNGNRSRIVVTTRITKVSSHLSSSSLAMCLLDDNESWKLFCATTFGKEECPLNLVDIGKNIVRKCRGLPLSIVVIGGHLKRASRMKEEWETVARNMMLFLDSGEDQCLSILSLSYTHLPACLKPCFLYMGVFPEDKKIDVGTLIRFWVAEGFLQPHGARSCEEIAESYLKDLVDRNLILVHKQGWNGKILTCGVHDLVRELCLKVGRKERFFCVLKHGGGSSRCKHWEGFGGSGIYLAAEKQWQLDESRLVELLPNIVEKNLDELFDQHLEFRYIHRHFWKGELDIQSRLPSSISLCWYLQTLVVHTLPETILAPSEIWGMSWLRHLNIMESIHLPNPPKRHFVMRNLQTLMRVQNLRMSENVCRRIPNIKDLHIYYSFEPWKMSHLKYCQKLESLRLDFDVKRYGIRRSFVRKLTYPSMLQVLRLVNPGLHWEDLSMIGLLPNLQIFMLSEYDTVKGEEWSPIQGQFLSLRSLEIGNCEDLVCWNADSSHFPVLKSLTLSHADKLMEFPRDIGKIPTLQRIELDRCSVSAAISAIRMLVEQEELGNEDLQLQVKFFKKKELERVKEMVEAEGIESKNLYY